MDHMCEEHTVHMGFVYLFVKCVSAMSFCFGKVQLEPDLMHFWKEVIFVIVLFRLFTIVHIVGMIFGLHEQVEA